MTTTSPALPRRPGRRRFRLLVVLASVVAAIVGSVLLLTHRAAGRVTTRGVTATLTAPGRPGWVAAGSDALWLALTDTRTTVRDRPLLRVDLASAAVEQRVLPGGRASYLVHVGNRLLASVEHEGGTGSGPSQIVALDWRTARVLARRQFANLVGPLAESGNDLWALQVRPAALLRLDPRTLIQTAAPIPLSQGRALGLAAGNGRVWATEPDAGDVLRIDGGTRAVVRAHVGGFPVGIAVAAGAVWVADRDRGELDRLDPRTLLRVGKPIRVGGKPGWLARAGPYLFIGDASRGVVSKIDVRSGTRAGRPIRIAPPAEAGSALTVSPAGSSVWVGSFASGTLTRVSASSADAQPPAVAASSSRPAGAGGHALPPAGKVVASIPVPPRGGAFAVGEGAVWAMSDTTSTLLRIDPRRNAVIARIHVPPGDAAAAGNGAVWLSHPQQNTLSRIDPKTDTVRATIRVGPQPSGVAVSPGAVWVADAGGPSVTRIDPATNRVVGTVRVGPRRECCTKHMGVVAAGAAVWAAVPGGNRIVRIDPRTTRVAAGFTLGSFAPCGFIAADLRAVWTAGGICADAVARLDPRGKRPTARIPEPHPVGLSLAFGSVWVAAIVSGDVDRIDPRTAKVTARLHVGGFPVRLVTGFGSVWVNDDKGRVLRIRPRG